MRPTLHSQAHEWRDRDEDNNVRIVRAEWDARKWNFRYTLKTEADWHEVDSPTLDMLEALRDVLWRKYQRKRLSWKFIEDLDKEIAELKGDLPPEVDDD